MKQILYQAMEQAPSAEVVEPEVIARYYAKFGNNIIDDLFLFDLFLLIIL